MPHKVDVGSFKTIILREQESSLFPWPNRFVGTFLHLGGRLRNPMDGSMVVRLDRLSIICAMARKSVHTCRYNLKNLIVVFHAVYVEE